MLFFDPFVDLCAQSVSLHSTHVCPLFLPVNLFDHSAGLLVQTVVRVFCSKLIKAPFDLLVKLSVNLVDSPNHFFPSLSQVVELFGQVGNVVYFSAVFVL